MIKKNSKHWDFDKSDHHYSSPKYKARHRINKTPKKHSLRFKKQKRNLESNKINS
jgi:hypothetical protein